MAEAQQQIVYSHKDLITLLLKDQGIHEGMYDISIELQIAVGGFGPTPEQVLPGAMLGVSRIGIAKAHQVGPNTVDAAVVNPKKIAVKRAKPTS